VSGAPPAAEWPSYEQWLSGGRRIALPRLGYEVFLRSDGPEDGPPLTLLHGFPSSSHDWAAVLPALAATHRVLCLDFLGYGDSDKPHEHRYSLLEQADLVQEVWETLGFPADGALVVHDYAVSVAQELLARGLTPRRLAWLNGGLYPDLHRLTQGQQALIGPAGAAISEQLTPELLAAGVRGVLAREVPEAVLEDLAAGAARREGLRNAHLLIDYVRERREHEARWAGALESCPVPYAFVWGMRDPVSGAHMLERVRARMPQADYTILGDVGHYPQMEAPDLVAPVLVDFLEP